MSLSDEKKAEIKQAFLLYGDNDGESADERFLGAILKSVSIVPTALDEKDYAKQCVEGGRITQAAFTSMMQKKATTDISEHDLLAAFQVCLTVTRRCWTVMEMVT